MQIKEKIEEYVREALIKAGGPSSISFEVDHPADFKNGDYSTNVALKAVGPVSHGVKEDKNVNKKQSFVRYQFGSESFKNPIELAEKIKEFISEKIKEFKIEIAGPGFINFYLPKQFFAESIKEINDQGEKFGETKLLAGQKIMVEYTDPNPFKEFHIGHLMSNAIGESVSRIIENNGAEIKRANWQGDVGMHVAKAIWGKIQKPDLAWGEAYAYGANSFEENKEEIVGINKKIYERTDEKINQLYDLGRKESLEEFEKIYARLGTKFDYYFFESKEGVKGQSIVESHIEDGIFEKSDGAVIFRGEQHGLHTRVFVNSNGIPTYEAKELGLNKEKFEVEPDLAKSIIVTGNEIKDYFKVLLEVISLIFPDIAQKTFHLPHGMLRLREGKMSSRTGNIITTETLIDQVKEKVLEKIQGREFSEEEKENIAEMVAIGAIKYSILRQAIGGDIVFDFEKSISFEGDSGPYLQYTAVRAKSVLEKAPSSKLQALSSVPENWDSTEVERMLYRFPEIVERAGQEYAPHHLVTYLTELASAFNSFYGNNKIISEEDPTSSYKVALTESVYHVLKNGLHLLGIKVPERM
jgi:arginyl-tRNA synthetase